MSATTTDSFETSMRGKASIGGPKLPDKKGDIISIYHEAFVRLSSQEDYSSTGLSRIYDLRAAWVRGAHLRASTALAHSGGGTRVGMADVVACTGTCSNGGCIDGTCTCPAGWTGNADLLTGDLTAWGGDLLHCSTHLLTLRVMWTAILLHCVVALIVTPCTLHQQWQKFRAARTQGARKHWFQHRPLLIVAGHAAIALVICSTAIVKVTPPSFRRVIGIDPYLSIAFMLFATLGIPISAVFFLDMLTTFSKGIRSEMNPSPWWEKAIGIARILFIVAACFAASTGVSIIADLSASPVSGRRVHVVCLQLVCFQKASAFLLLFVASIVFTVEIVRSINHTLRERAVLARWTRSPELRQSLKSLRRTGAKVIMLQSTVIVFTAVNFGITISIATVAKYQQYIAYCIAYDVLGYMQIVLLVIHTYTSIGFPTRARILASTRLSRFTPRRDSPLPSGRVRVSSALALNQLNVATAVADFNGVPAATSIMSQDAQSPHEANDSPEQTATATCLQGINLAPAQPTPTVEQAENVGDQQNALNHDHTTSSQNQQEQTAVVNDTTQSSSSQERHRPQHEQLRQSPAPPPRDRQAESGVRPEWDC
eukprot:6188867-Pleurochrysis_carterae.AAC.1